MTVENIKQILQEVPGFEEVNVTGDGYHFQVRVISKDFEGKTKVSRQRMVYQHLKHLIADGSLHAVELTTLTPSERGSDE
jgi:acid stress-induced BolA-like protein IbaG/YrbA